MAYDFSAEYDYVGRAHTDFGKGNEGAIAEQYTDLRQVWTRRFMLAFLLHAGVEWQRMAFTPPNALLAPEELDAITGFFAADFRWSDHDMMRVQLQPGFYTDLDQVDLQSINVPLAVAYTRIPSKRFQWAFGVSINTWRQAHFLPGGGFRYQLTDRWKLKFMLPTPQIEYKVNDSLHTWVGADFRGETYRVSGHFGTEHGNPSLNHALVDYQEIREGIGLSWNIKPLLEFNSEVGFLHDRSFNFHNNGNRSSGATVPYISLNLRWLFQVIKDDRPMNQQIRAMQIEFPSLTTLFKLP